MKIHVIALNFALCLSLCACSGLPRYTTNSTQTIPIRVQGKNGNSFIVIRKLSNDCHEESDFKNAIGANPSDFQVSADDRKFSFKLLFISPLMVGCEVRNTIDIEYGYAYRILLESPPPGSPKNEACKLRLEKAEIYGYTLEHPSFISSLENPKPGWIVTNPLKWIPENFTNQCVINQRF